MFGQIIIKIKQAFIPCEKNDYKPKILAGNFLVYFLIGLIVLKFISLGFLLEFPNSSFFADVSETALVRLLNIQRGELGLGRLTLNPQLSQAAELKAQDMLTNNYFSHDSPQGITPWHWFKVSGYDYHYAGENLGIGFIESEEVHNAWNDSPSHKENLLNANYNEIGIAVLRGNFNGADNTIVVQFFGTKYQPLPSVLIPTSAPSVVDEPKKVVSFTTDENVKGPAAAIVQLKSVEVAGEEIEAINGDTVEIASFYGVNIEFAGTTDENISFRFFKFMAINYDNLLQGFIFYSLAFISLLLIINVFVKINIQHKGLTFKVLGLLALLVLCVYINKDIMLKFIPHVVSIY